MNGVDNRHSEAFELQMNSDNSLEANYRGKGKFEPIEVYGGSFFLFLNPPHPNLNPLFEMKKVQKCKSLPERMQVQLWWSILHF